MESKIVYVRDSSLRVPLWTVPLPFPSDHECESETIRRQYKRSRPNGGKKKKDHTKFETAVNAPAPSGKESDLLFFLLVDQIMSGR